MCSGICQSCLHVWATTTRARTQHLDADNHARTCVILQLPTYVAGRPLLQYNPARSTSIIPSLQACFSRCLSTTCCRPHTLGSLFLQASSPHWFQPACCCCHNTLTQMHALPSDLLRVMIAFQKSRDGEGQSYENHHLKFVDYVCAQVRCKQL